MPGVYSISWATVSWTALADDHALARLRPSGARHRPWPISEHRAVISRVYEEAPA